MSGFFYFPAILLIWLCGPRQYACPPKAAAQGSILSPLRATSSQRKLRPFRA
jgi:hypothetical protein